jgi:hypothetical protein
VILVGLGFFHVLRRAGPAGDHEVPIFPKHEWALLWSLTLLPVLTVFIAMATTGAFVYRYAIPAMLGICTLFAALVFRLTRGQSRQGTAVLLALLGMYAALRLAPGTMSEERPGAADAQLLAGRLLSRNLMDGTPVVVSVPHLFLEAEHYAPKTVANSLVYLTDPDAALRYNGSNTAELNLERLSPWTSLRVRRYRDFLAEGGPFLLYHRPNHRFEWITRKLADEGWELTLIAEGDDFAILRCCEREWQ